MPRRQTPKAGDACHITIRCNDKKRLFNLNSTYDQMVNWVNCLPMFFSVKIHHVLFMSNHMHFMVTPTENNLGQAMSYFLTNLSKFLNRENNTINHVFGNRYAATVITEEKYFLNVIRYIYQNPVRAGLCKNLLEYQFSSLHQYLGFGNHKIILEPDQYTRTQFDFGMIGQETWLHWISNSLESFETELVRDSLAKGTYKFTKKQYLDLLGKKTSLHL